MEVLKAGLVVLAGLGSTWAVRSATEALLGPPPAALAQAPPAGSGSAPAAAPPAVPQMSPEEMEAELKRAQAELAGRKVDEAELREFRPTRPLPADLPIALPSDI